MTNTTIIVNAALDAGIFTEEQIKQYLESIGELPLHTFNGWKERTEQEIYINHYYKKLSHFFTVAQAEPVQA